CLKVGVIGLGKMGLLHASIVNVLSNVQLSAVCDTNERIIMLAKKMFNGIYVIDNIEKLFELNLDAIYITTPIPTHFPIIETIHSKGMVPNLFVEKTLASSYEEATKLCQIVQRSGVVNMVGYMGRFTTTFKKAKELLDQVAIGKILSFEAYAYSSDFVGSRKKSFVRGGVLRDLGSHIIDTALWFFGDLEVESVKLDPLTPEGSEDSGYFQVKGLNRLEGEFDVSWCKEGYRSPEFGLTIRGTKGNIKVNTDAVKLESDNGSHIWHRHDLNDTVGFLLGAPEYFREDEHFIKSILGGYDGEPNFFSASKVDCFIDQIKRKAR
ncbi:MAG: Gfo/Idh/MocA family oxidoreductase, partial [Nitrososphaerota archaeon]